MSVLSDMNVIQEDPVNRLIAQFKQKDLIINRNFDALEELQAQYDEDSHSNLKLTMQMEFILMRLRIHVSSEITTIKGLMTTENLNAIIQSSFRKRLDYLTTVDSKLTELREDFNSIQKMAYTLKMQIS